MKSYDTVRVGDVGESVRNVSWEDSTLCVKLGENTVRRWYGGGPKTALRLTLFALCSSTWYILNIQSRRDIYFGEKKKIVRYMRPAVPGAMGRKTADKQD